MLSGKVFAVPRHDLGNEVKAKFRAKLDEAGLHCKTVSVWRGAEAEDPDTPKDEFGKHLQMCRSEHLKDARLAMVPVTSLCKGSDGSLCPHIKICGYQKQLQREPADVSVVTHSLLFGPRPDNIPPATVIIIDEALELVEEKNVDKRFLEKRICVSKMSDDGCLKIVDDQSNELAANLMPLRNRLNEAIEVNGRGPFKLSSLKAVGLTAVDCRLACNHERKRIVHFPPKFNVSNSMVMTDTLRKLASANAKTIALAEIWKALADYLATCDREFEQRDCGRVAVEIDEKGRTNIVVRLVKGIHKDWEGDVIYADATLREGLARTVLPDLKLAADIEAHAPHQRTILKVGKSFSHSTLRSGMFSDSSDNDIKQIIRLLANLNVSAALTKGKTVAVVAKFIEETIKSKGLSLHPRLAFMHHGAVSGIDEHRDCDRLIVVGRLLPSVSDIEGMAGGITGLMPATRLQGSYLTDWDTVYASNAQSTVVKRWRHPDPLCDKLLKSICDDQLIQAIGRARGVNRTEANPVTVELWGEVVPHGVQIDAIECYSDASKDEEAMAMGLWVSNAKHLSMLWPDLGSDNAVKMARQQRTGNGERLGSFPYIKSSIGKGPLPPGHLGVADYQLVGSGQKIATVIWDPAQVSDARALLERKLGPLAKFVVKSERGSATLH